MFRSRGVRGRGGAPVSEKFSSAPRGRGQRRGTRLVETFALCFFALSQHYVILLYITDQHRHMVWNTLILVVDTHRR